MTAPEISSYVCASVDLDPTRRVSAGYSLAPDTLAEGIGLAIRRPNRWIACYGARQLRPGHLRAWTARAWVLCDAGRITVRVECGVAVPATSAGTLVTIPARTSTIVGALVWAGKVTT